MMKICISVTSNALYPLPCHKLSHLLGPPPPSSVTYFMDGPLTVCQWLKIANFLVQTFSGIGLRHVSITNAKYRIQ